MIYPNRILGTLMIILIVISLFSCKKEDIRDDYYGYWSFEYSLLDDGTKNYNFPYAMMEYNYSDAFKLCEDKTGYSRWDQGSISLDSVSNLNCLAEFDWNIIDNTILRIDLKDNSIVNNVLDFKISDFSNETMLIESPKGFKYFVRRVK